MLLGSAMVMLEPTITIDGRASEENGDRVFPYSLDVSRDISGKKEEENNIMTITTDPSGKRQAMGMRVWMQMSPLVCSTVYRCLLTTSD